MDILKARHELRSMRTGDVLKLALNWRLSFCLIGARPCGFLLQYKGSIFCVSEILGKGCQVGRLMQLEQLDDEREKVTFSLPFPQKMEAELLLPTDRSKKRNTTPPIEVIDSENRRYPRFDIHLPIEYWQIKPSIAHTGNISEGGFLICFPEEKDINQYLSLKLFFSLGSELDTIKVVGKVVWTDSHLSKDGEHYPYGVKFIDISPEDGNKLRNFLKSLSSPLDDMFCLFNTVEMRLRKLMDFTGVTATEKTIESVPFQKEKKTQKESSQVKGEDLAS